MLYFLALIPFLGTSLGALFVFFMKNSFNKKLNFIILGLSGGIMLASAIFSLLLPSIEAKNGIILAPLGLALGILVFAFLDSFVLKKKKRFSLAVTIHNFPEGLAVGVAIGGAMLKEPIISSLAVLSLAIGIAVQNIPEGMVISLPAFYLEGYSKKRAFLKGVLSGLVEPIASLIAIIFISFISSTLPLFLSFATGAMFYVIFSEIIVSIDEEKMISYCSFTVGFILMMLLDVLLG